MHLLRLLKNEKKKLSNPGSINGLISKSEANPLSTERRNSLIWFGGESFFNEIAESLKVAFPRVCPRKKPRQNKSKELEVTPRSQKE